MVAPVFNMPVRRTRKYYAAPDPNAAAYIPRVVTNNRFSTDGVTENVKVDNDLKWRLDLEEHVVAKHKYARDIEARTENGACIYNLVL